MIIEDKRISDKGNKVYPHLVILSSVSTINKNRDHDKFQFKDVYQEQVADGQTMYTLVCLEDDNTCKAANVTACLDAIEIQHGEAVAVMLFKDIPNLPEIRKGLDDSHVPVTVYCDIAA